MRYKSEDPEQLRSQDFDELALVLVPQIAALVQKAKRDEYSAPFELLITDADDIMVCQFQVNDEGVMQPLDQTDAILKARSPLTITLTDKKGEKWETMFARPDEKSIQ
jgi:hypothetical protein